MSTDTTVRTKESSAPEALEPKPVSLSKVVEEVRRDSQLDAKQYLTDTEVPHGGE